MFQMMCILCTKNLKIPQKCKLFIIKMILFLIKFFFHMIRCMIDTHILFPLMVVIQCGKSHQQFYQLPIDITNISKNKFIKNIECI